MADEPAEAAGTPAQPLQPQASCSTQKTAFSFQSFASQHGLGSFCDLLQGAGLTEFVETCEAALTIFAPTDEAIARLSEHLPTDMQLLRELLCVHITMGSLTHKDLLNTRSITTIGQQTHHVAVLEPDGQTQQPLQVGTAVLVHCDVLLPDGRGVVHIVDCVMCCLRLLQHCRFEQVWNKTVRPSPKVALQGEWRPHVDELHAILIHCDSWQPLFQGLRGAMVPLHASGADKAGKSFQENIVNFHELLILEKPPEMSKKKRKKKEEAGALPGAECRDVAHTAHYRMMFSLYRRDTDAPMAEGATVSPGKHLTFCMAPEDILIRNSFHMLSETEKEARRAEYKALTDGSTRHSAKHPQKQRSDASGIVSLSTQISVQQQPSVSSQPSQQPQLLQAQPLTSQSQPTPLLIDSSGSPPALLALSTSSGRHSGGTSVWIQGSNFGDNSLVYVANTPAQNMVLVSDTLMTINTPPMLQGSGTVEIRATNNRNDWSNPMHFTYTSDGGMEAEGTSVDSQLMQRELSLLQQFVQACCGNGAEASVHALMAPTLPQPQRLFGAVLALILAGSGGTNHKGGALDLERQDAHGCTLMHYVCALRNSPALQLLLRANVDPTISDIQGLTASDWARAYRFHEGEAVISRTMGTPDADAGGGLSGCGQQLASLSSVKTEEPASSAAAEPGAASAAAPCAAVAEEAASSAAAATPAAAPATAMDESADGAAPAPAAPQESRTRSLEHFLEPNGQTLNPSTSQDVHQRSLAGFLTSAAAHIESDPTV